MPINKHTICPKMSSFLAELLDFLEFFFGMTFAVYVSV